MIEMTEQVVNYLRRVVQHQVATGGEKRKHPRDTVPIQDRVDSDQVGVSFSYTRQKFRAYRGGITRFFKPSAFDEAVACAKNNMVIDGASAATIEGRPVEHEAAKPAGPSV